MSEHPFDSWLYPPKSPRQANRRQGCALLLALPAVGAAGIGILNLIRIGLAPLIT